MKMFYVWFFLVGGAWHPGWEYEGWAPRAAGGDTFEAQTTSCEIGKALAEGISVNVEKKPDNLEGVGEIHGAFVHCFAVEMPK